MESILSTLSTELAKVAAELGTQIVAVHARPYHSSSGVQWRPGVIVTAEHTVRRDEDIHVTLADGRTVSATLAGRDPGTDVAVLKVEGLSSPAMDTSRREPLQVGHVVVVLGRSRERGLTASLGILSAVSGAWRTWRGGRLDQYVRLDGKLSSHASGGAVVDTHGRVLGVATAALSPIAGLAIPATTINRVTDRLLAKGPVGRGYLGIGLHPIAIPDDLRTRLSLSNRGGIIVLSVEPGGPADTAGVLIGDVLLALDGLPLEGLEELQSFLDSESVGKTARARILRGGALTELTVVVGERSPRSR
jgi:S1-C subfamily serine protease